MADIKQPPPSDLRTRAGAAAETAAAAGVINEETLRRIVNGKVSRAVLDQVRKAVTRALTLTEAGNATADNDNAASERSRRHKQELAAAQTLYRAVVQLFGSSDDLESEIERAADEQAEE